uniref:Uncharacterized protein n=1 Tax=Arundo donax TaxID=35708 RepID=A0A0A9CCY2_ARUDO
MKILVKGHIL